MCGSRQRGGTRFDAVADRDTPAEGVDMRASDAERDQVVQSLRDHAASGRLSADELEERVGSALEARTLGDLDGLLRDLPRERGRRRSEARREAARRGFREHLRTYVMVMALLVTIWALTGMGYFWPVWPMVGWGIGLWSHAASVPRRRRARAGDALART